MENKKKRLPLSLWFKVRFTSKPLSDEEELIFVERSSLMLFKKKFSKQSCCELKNQKAFELLMLKENEEKLSHYSSIFKLPLDFLEQYKDTLSDEDWLLLAKYWFNVTISFVSVELKDDNLLAKIYQHDNNWKKIGSIVFISSSYISHCICKGFDNTSYFLLKVLKEKNETVCLSKSDVCLLIENNLKKTLEFYIKNFQLDVQLLRFIFNTFDEKKIFEIVKNVNLNIDAFEWLILYGNERLVLEQLKKQPKRKISSYHQKKLLELNNKEITELFICNNDLLNEAERFFIQQNDKELIIKYLDKGDDVFNTNLLFNVCDQDIHLHYLKLYRTPYYKEREFLAFRNNKIIEPYLILLQQQKIFLYEENEALLMEFVNIELFEEYFTRKGALCEGAEVSLMKKGDNDVRNFYINHILSCQNKSIHRYAEYWLMLNGDIDTCVSYIRQISLSSLGVTALLKRNESLMIEAYAKEYGFGVGIVEDVISSKNKSAIINLLSIPYIKLNNSIAQKILKTEDVNIIETFINSGLLDNAQDDSDDTDIDIVEFETMLLDVKDYIFYDVIKCYIEKYALCPAAEVKLLKKKNLKLLNLYVNKYGFCGYENITEFFHLN